MKRVPRQHRNKEVRRERDGRALRRQIVLLACGLTVACGFVLAVGQHYAAVRYGYEGERLREHRRQLLAERDRLLMELSAAESPVTLERAAREIGMQPARPSQMGTSRRRDEEAAGQQSRDAADGRAGASDERANAADARRGSKRGEEKLSASKPDARRATRERVAAQGVGDSRPRVVGQPDAKAR
jgi:hypothetical protein